MTRLQGRRCFLLGDLSRFKVGGLTYWGGDEDDMVMGSAVVFGKKIARL